MCRLFIIIVNWFAINDTIENDNYVFSCAAEHMKKSVECNYLYYYKDSWVCNDCYNTNTSVYIAIIIIQSIIITEQIESELV